MRNKILWSDETKTLWPECQASLPEETWLHLPSEPWWWQVHGMRMFSVAGRLVRIEGKMNGAKYSEILDENQLVKVST